MTDSDSEPENIEKRLRNLEKREKRRKRSRSPHTRPSFDEASTFYNDDKPTKKYYKNFTITAKNSKKDAETETASSTTNTKESTSKKSRYAPPSKTYGQMAKELKTHKWNEKNLARLNENLKLKNERSQKNYEIEKKISANKEDRIDLCKIKNIKLEKKLNQARHENDELNDEIYEKNKKIKKLKTQISDKDEYIADLEEQLRICKNKLDKKGDKKSKNYRYKNARSSDSDW